MSTNPAKIIGGLIDIQNQIGDFIANGPADGIGGYVRDQYRDRCDQFANVPDWALALSPIARQSINNWCEPYWEDNARDGPVSEPDFTGGQCPGVLYTFTWSRFAPGQSLPNGVNDLVGPLVLDTSVAPGDENLCDGNPDGPYASFTMRGANNTAVSLITGCGVSASILSVTPTFGGPNDCGDPAPTFKPGPNPPPNPGPTPGPAPEDDPFGGPFPTFPIPDWPGPLADYPIVSPPEDSPSSEPGPATGGDGLPGDGGAIGGAAGDVSGDGDGEEIDFGPPPEGRIWVGCIVDLTVDSRIGNIPGTGPQSTVWPSVRGNVALKYSTLFGSSQRINSRYTELFRPNTALTVTGCFLQVQPGGVGTVFPISALTCPENPCGEQNG